MVNTQELNRQRAEQTVFIHLWSGSMRWIAFQKDQLFLDDERAKLFGFLGLQVYLSAHCG